MQRPLRVQSIYDIDDGWDVQYYIYEGKNAGGVHKVPYDEPAYNNESGVTHDPLGHAGNFDIDGLGFKKQNNILKKCWESDISSMILYLRIIDEAIKEYERIGWMPSKKMTLLDKLLKKANVIYKRAVSIAKYDDNNHSPLYDIALREQDEYIRIHRIDAIQRENMHDDLSEFQIKLEDYFRMIYNLHENIIYYHNVFATRYSERVKHNLQQVPIFLKSRFRNQNIARTRLAGLSSIVPLFNDNGIHKFDFRNGMTAKNVKNIKNKYANRANNKSANRANNKSANRRSVKK